MDTKRKKRKIKSMIPFLQEVRFIFIKVIRIFVNQNILPGLQ